MIPNNPIINKIIDKAADYVPVVGTSLRLVKTAKKVYNCTNPVSALTTAARCVIVDCTPPVIKYPALCGAALGCSAIGFCTADPRFVAGGLEFVCMIIED